MTVLRVSSRLKEWTVEIETLKNRAVKLNEIYGVKFGHVESSIDSVLVLSSKITSSSNYFQAME